MSWRIPTVPEVFEKVGCILYGHDWDGGAICRVCGEER